MSDETTPPRDGPAPQAPDSADAPGPFTQDSAGRHRPEDGATFPPPPPPGGGPTGEPGPPNPPGGPPPAGPVLRPPLQRSKSDRYVAGVCGGLGRAFDIDPVIFRIGVAVLTVFGGVGLVLYGLGWLLLPEEGTPESEGQRLLSRRSGNTTALIIGGAVVIGLLLLLAGGPDFGAVALLAALALVILAATRRESGPPPGPDQPAAQPGLPDTPGEYVPSWLQSTTSSYAAPPAYAPPGTPGGIGYGPGDPYPPSYVPPTAAPFGPPAGYRPDQSPSLLVPPPPPAKRRVRSPLGRLTLSAAALVAGTLIVIDLATDATITAQVVLAAVTAVIGLGLVVGGKWGRPRGLVGAGLASVLALVIVGAVDAPFRDGTGERVWAPTTLAEIASPYRFGGGEATLDLTGLGDAPAPAAGSGPINIDARLGVGQLLVIVPEELDVVVDGHAGVGQVITPDGESSDGISGDRTYDVEGTAPAGPELNIDAQVGFGQVEVRRE